MSFYTAQHKQDLQLSSSHKNIIYQQLFGPLDDLIVKFIYQKPNVLRLYFMKSWHLYICILWVSIILIKYFLDWALSKFNSFWFCSFNLNQFLSISEFLHGSRRSVWSSPTSCSTCLPGGYDTQTEASRSWQHPRFWWTLGYQRLKCHNRILIFDQNLHTRDHFVKPEM